MSTALVQLTPPLPSPPTATAISGASTTIPHYRHHRTTAISPSGPITRNYISTTVNFYLPTTLLEDSFITIGGPAYLNFMGNEFGHPKRVEHPMPSKNFSFSLVNHLWDLLEAQVHKELFSFDKDMMNFDEKERILSRGLPNIHHVNDIFCYGFASVWTVMKRNT